MSAASEYISTIIPDLFGLNDKFAKITNFTSLTLRNSTMYMTNDSVGIIFPKQYSRPPLDWTAKVLIPLYAVIFVLAVVGNLLVILTLFQNKRMRTVTNVLLLNLSVSDILLAVFCMPFTFIPVLLRNFPFGAVMCVMIRYLQGKLLKYRNAFIQLANLCLKEFYRYAFP